MGAGVSLFARMPNAPTGSTEAQVCFRREWHLAAMISWLEATPTKDKTKKASAAKPSGEV
jgi:hypothetical protein